jgi:5-formyltetrahydrofolate cyclo-ligase
MMSSSASSSGSADVFAAKKALRKQMKATLAAMSSEEKAEQSHAIAQKLFNDPDFIKAK